MFLTFAALFVDKCFARNLSRISELRINRRSVLTINLSDTALSTLDFATRRSVNVASCFGDALVTSNLPNSLRERRHNRKIPSKKQGISMTRCSHYHSTRSTPSFISCACPVDLPNLDWKSDPPCAILMASFLPSARTINFDGRLSSCGKSRCIP